MVTVLLPPDAVLESVAVAGTAGRHEDVPGVYEVAATPPAATWTPAGQVLSWPQDRTLVDGRDAAIYAEDAYWPAAQATLVSAGELRGWCVARAALPLVQYNPVRKRLRVLREAKPVLVCEQSKGGPRQAVDETSYERVRELCVNFVDESGAYPAPAPGAPIRVT